MPEDPTASPDTELTELMSSSDEEGQMIGHYRLLQQIGEGGMGEVWEALQTEPVQRRVALKLIKPGMDSKEVIARFESERQALALMDHSAIAKVFEAGTTEQGRPFFVMEHVPGVPITDYCDRRRMSLRERLELFIEACAGIQHAHQKAIIHRDVKPSNILVGEGNGVPVPKIIDFGVAKALAQRLTERTLFTELGQMIGTPEYMSPEQADLTGEDIDIRTDVYSLGMVLYELLVGALPFDSRELRQAGLAELQRKIREDEPPKPSTRMSRLGEASTASSKNRATTPQNLIKTLRGDLDWITLKALEKDRTRRYETVNALALDIQRYLDQEPVRARPPSATYRLGKFVRRNRGKVAACGALIALALGFGAFSTLNISKARERAEQEAAKAQAVNEFLEEMLSSADPVEGTGREVTVRQAIEQAVETIDDSFVDQPATRAAVQQTIGNTLMNLGQYDDAELLLSDALETLRSLPEGSRRDKAEVLKDLGTVADQKGDLEGAEAFYRESLTLLLDDEEPREIEIAGVRNDLAIVLRRQNELDQAAVEMRGSVEAFRRHFGGDHRFVGIVLNNLGLVYRDNEEYEKAESVLREALEILRNEVGESHPLVADAVNNLALVQYSKGDLESAEELFRESIEITRETLGEAHPDLASTLNSLGAVLRRKGELDAAEELHLQAISIFTETVPDSWELFNTRLDYGTCLTAMERYEEAESELLLAQEAFRDSFDLEHPRTQRALSRVVALYEAWGKAEAAEEYRALLQANEETR